MIADADADAGPVAAFERRFELAVLQDLVERAGYGKMWSKLVGAAVSPDHELADALLDTVGWQAATRQFQRGLFERALEACGGNVTMAAQRLGMSRSHVYNIISSH